MFHSSIQSHVFKMEIYRLLPTISVVLFFTTWNVHSAVHKIDITVFQPSILVDIDGIDDVQYRGYLAEGYKDGTFNIGRTSDTGPGDVDEEIIDPTANVYLNDGFPSNSKVGYASLDTHKRIDVKLEGSLERKERIGAFYVTAVHNAETVKITTIKRPQQATIKASYDTVTASIGDSVTLTVTTSLSDNLMRWRHNAGDFITEWGGKTTVTIPNVRKADEGIYECFEDNYREDGVHAVMRLIVRACPRGKYGSECNNNCETCYNGGMCEDSSGVCVCRPGFKGGQCEKGCGNNHWGATCTIRCSRKGNCGRKSFCVPDPVGCSCIAGFTGDDCNTACPTGFYGANCEQTCHCQNNCNNAEGCTGECETGYGGIACQVPDACPTSMFGDLCDRQCHCENSNICPRDTGECSGNQCAPGWGGTYCQQALPTLFEFQSTVSVRGTTLLISWNAWNENVDYGTGPVEKYQVYFGQQGQALEPGSFTFNAEVEISDLLHETPYEFAVSAYRYVDGYSYEGIRGPSSTKTTGCGVPTKSPTSIKTTVTGPTSVEVEWTIPEIDDGDWIRCSTGIDAFIISYGTDAEKVEDSTATRVTINKLSPCATYQFRVQVANKDMAGPKSVPSMATTAPKAVLELSVTTPSSESLKISWTQPSECEVTDYIVSHRLVIRDQCLPEQHLPIDYEIMATSIIIDDLEAYSTYEVVVSGIIGTIKGEAVDGSGITDDEAPSGSPSNITHDLSEEMALTYNWEKPMCGSRKGEITKYEYAFGLDIENGKAIYGSTEPDNRMVFFPNPDYYRDYQFQIRANTSAGSGPYSDMIVVTTPESSPDAPPKDIKADNIIVKRQLSFSWQQPSEDDRNGVIILYEYQFDIYAETILTEWAVNGSSPDTYVIFQDLPHYTDFQFRVRALTSIGPGPFSKHVIGKTLPSAPSAPQQLLVVQNFTAEIELEWKRPSDLNGELIAYVITGTGDKTATITTNLDGDNVIGNLTGLNSGTIYTITVHGVTNGGEGPVSNQVIAQTLEPKPKPSSNVGIAVGVSLSIILVLVAVFLGIVFLKRRPDKRSKTQGVNATNNTYATPMEVSRGNINITFDESEVASFGETSSDGDTDRLKPRAIVTPDEPVVSYQRDRPVLLEDFIDYVKSKRYDVPDHELLFDYQALSTNHQSAMTVSKKKENIKKNRYKNIITYDHSRVCLEPLDGDPDSDYINASYIDGYQKKNAYIAAQGPNTTTLNDMWRMIWQENSQTIIMATKCVEGPKKKCDQYWPNYGKTLVYGSVIVVNSHEEERDFYTIRTLLICRSDEEDAEKRSIKQFHFTGWPDMKAPEFAEPVLQLLEEVNEYNPSDAGPIVVHCSAGVGRTGTFITIDSMLKMVRAEGKLDIFNFVCQMRSRRVFMVQAESQYEFIHDALLEALFCSDTMISNADMERTWAHANGDNTWLSDQHGALAALFPAVSLEKCKGATNPENVTKNRYPDRIPPDSSRPYLMSISDSGGTNYINATFCNGYKKDNMYLATQVPLPNTVNDFWCMMYDYKCYIIVALNDPKKKDKTCGHYCPDEGTLTCGAFTIEAISMKHEGNVVKKKLKLYKGGNKGFNVTQIQYTEWSDKDQFAKSSNSFLQLLQHVEEGRRECGDERMAIMCMDGVTRCGIVSAMISMIDQIKEEQQVDVLQSVKRLRKARHDMVQSLAQYKYCYEMVREYLQGFDTYANFTT